MQRVGSTFFGMQRSHSFLGSTLGSRSVMLTIVVILMSCAWSHAQESQGQASPDVVEQETSVAEVSTGEGPVGVDSEPDDTRIARRIEEILASTKRFEHLGVDVRDGVVFLSGQAADEKMRTLAVDLAQRTQGVAAVVNNITLAQEPFWTIAPARDELDRLMREIVRFLPLLVIGLVLLALFILAAGSIGRVAARLIAHATDSELLRNVLRKAVVLVVMVFGIYLALRVTGLTRVALALVSGTGLVGLALGFAFRDIAENFLASILLSVQRPFQLGDVIEVDSHTGVVRKVTARGTLLIDFEGNHIQIANATVYKNTIKNFSANPKMRIDFTLGVGYDDEITRAQEVARRVLADHAAVLDDPEPLVLVEELGSSTVNLRIYFWINSAQHSILKMKSSVIRLTLRALAQEGVSMPDEAREVIFPQGVPVQITRHADADPGSPGSPGQPGDSGEQGGDTGESSAPQRHQPVEKPRAERPDSSEVAVDAEGDLTTETHDLNRQAQEARDPEVGSNVFDESKG